MHEFDAKIISERFVQSPAFPLAIEKAASFFDTNYERLSMYANRINIKDLLCDFEKSIMFDKL